MSNMLSNGISGLNAAQAALATVSNNIANADTAGYSRESVNQVETVSPGNGLYTIGGGVDVVSVQRAYSQYLTAAVWSANTGAQGATTMSGLTTTLNSLLSNSGNLTTSLDTFYGDFSSIASAPSTASTRQAALADATSLTTTFNTLSQQFDEQSTQVNGQITDAVNTINSLSSQIATLNGQITQASASGAPNALLDERDNLVQQLSGQTGISAVTQPDGTISVTTTGGQSLVSGNQSYALSTKGNQYDPTSTDVYDSAGDDITAQLGSSGTLGALINYRQTVLQPAQNQLGQAALALASSVNGQQAQGLDLNGKQGQPIFSVGTPGVLPSSKNAGSATVGAAISDVSALTTSDYVLTYTGNSTAPSANGWSLSTTTGQSVALTANPDGTLSADGMTLTVSGTATKGDSYEIEPTRDAADSLSVSMTDPNGIAAAAALTATPGSSNTGSAKSTISVSDATNSALLSGATVTFGAGGSYTIKDGNGNTTTGTYTAGQPITYDGWSLSLSATPASGDTFAVAANTNGLNDNSNALTLAKLANTGVLDGGKTSVVQAYANLTTQIGSAGSLANTNLTTQNNLFTQAQGNQQNVAGVNLDEEASNMVQYQQAYQAAAQVISTSQQIFTSLISAIQG